MCVSGFVVAGLHRYTGHRSHDAAIIHRQGWRWIMLPPLPPPGPRPLEGQAFGWPAVIKPTAGWLSAWQIMSPALICRLEHANTPGPPTHSPSTGLLLGCKKKKMQEVALTNNICHRLVREQPALLFLNKTKNVFNSGPQKEMISNWFHLFLVKLVCSGTSLAFQATCKKPEA